MTKPILLLIIADEPGGEHYGATTRHFNDCDELCYNDRWSQFLSIARVLVDDKNRIVSVIDHVEEASHGCPVLHVIFKTHANSKVMRFGIDSTLSIEDRSLMRKIAKRIHPMGTITLAGCKTSARHYNIAKVFSQQAYGRIVYGSPIAPPYEDSDVFLREDLPPLYMPYFVPGCNPGYKPEPGKVNEGRVGSVDIYHNGHKIASPTNVHMLPYGDQQAIHPCLNEIGKIQKAILSISPSPQSHNVDSDSPEEHAAARREDERLDAAEDAIEMAAHNMRDVLLHGSLA